MKYTWLTTDGWLHDLWFNSQRVARVIETEPCTARRERYVKYRIHMQGLRWQEKTNLAGAMRLAEGLCLPPEVL